MSNRYTAYDEYGLQHLPLHLAHSGRAATLRAILLDFDWLQAKLGSTDINALIRDYELVPTDAELRLVQEALQLSAHVLLRDKAQLAGQLTGRLMTQDISNIRTMLEQVKQWRGAPWLRHLKPNLTPPGGPLLSTLAGHSGKITTVTVMPDGCHIVSASNDRTLKVYLVSHSPRASQNMAHNTILPTSKR